MRSLSLLLLVLLVACSDPEADLPPGPPVAVDYDAACDSSLHRHLVTVEGTLHLFPRLLSCYPGGNAPSGRSCQLKLLPAPDAPTGSVEIERAYYTVFVDEGRGPNQANPSGYGFGAPVKVLHADSLFLDPYDRVAITGRLHARPPVTGGDRLRCSLAAERIDFVSAASPSWAEEQDARSDSLQARIDALRARTDSMAAARLRRDSLRARTGE